VTRPGIRKTRGLPLVRERRVTLVRAVDPRWAELFEHADVISEGSARAEDEGRMWYGSTSLILDTGTEDATYLAAVVDRDPHVHLRAMRTARREAQVRAPGGLGRLTCEIRVSAEKSGVRIDVDVQAPLIERRARVRPAP